MENDENEDDDAGMPTETKHRNIRFHGGRSLH